MKKTGLPLDYPNIPQLSSVAATLLAAALPLPALPSHASPGGGREGANPAPQRERMQTKRPAHIVRAYSIRQAGLRLPSVAACILYHSPAAAVKRCRCTLAAALPQACPPEQRLPRRGTGGGEPCAAAHGFPLLPRLPRRRFCRGAQRRGADEPPRCRFPHAAGVGVSSRSPVSRVRRAAPRLLLAAVHRAVLHLGRRCSLWQSSTT